MYAIEKAMKAKGEHPEASDVIVPVLKEMFKACEQHKAKIPESTQLNQGESIVNAAASKYLEEARAADEAGRGDKWEAVPSQSHCFQANCTQLRAGDGAVRSYTTVPGPDAPSCDHLQCDHHHCVLQVAEKHQFSTQRAQVIRKALQSGQQFAPAPTTTPTTSAPAHGKCWLNRVPTFYSPCTRTNRSHARTTMLAARQANAEPG
eukprot:TRINITY_DN2552_c0_g1_i4.p1 TRINITY_DN2552_c0_g1~~TRINITY_DN2552_c0_g1_i4.p1  ORF type:complete len:205 (+),score=30.03 TRINITY_DN2552_c0_g1_i4:350-964(+)